MNIDEITNIQSGPMDFNKIDRSNERPLGQIDAFKLMNADNVYYLLNKNVIIAALLTEQFDDPDGDKWLITKEVFVDENYRGNDLAVMMYLAVKDSEKVSLISDDKHSESGKKLWACLADQTRVTVLDLETKESVPYDQADLSQVYTYGTNNKRLVAEAKSAFEVWSGVKENDEYRLMEVTYHPSHFRSRWDRF